RGTDLEVIFLRNSEDWIIRIEVEHQMRDIQYPKAKGWVQRHSKPRTAATILISTAAERTREWFANESKIAELMRREFREPISSQVKKALQDFAERRNVYYIPVDYYQELVIPLVLAIVFGREVPNPSTHG